MTGYFVKDPGSSLDHVVDWQSEYLAGRSIAESSWRVEPAGSTAISLSGAQLADGRTSIRIGGGAAGRVYRIVNRISLADGTSDERSLVLRVEDR